MSYLPWKDKSPSKRLPIHPFLSLTAEDHKVLFSSLSIQLPEVQYVIILPESKTHLENLRDIPYVRHVTAFEAEMESIKKIEAILRRNMIFKNLNNILDDLHKECEEEHFEVFSEIARKNAKKILSAIYEKFPDYECHIDPTEDQEIALDYTPQKGKGILILCDSKGGIACFATFKGKNKRFRHDVIDNSSYTSLLKMFEELEEKLEKNHSLTSSSTE